MTRYMLRCMLNDSLPNGFLIALFAPFDDQVTPFVGPGTINKYISDLYPLVNTPFFSLSQQFQLLICGYIARTLPMKSDNLLHCMWTVLQYDCRFPAHLLIRIEHGEAFSSSRIAIGAAYCIQCDGLRPSWSPRESCFVAWDGDNPSNCVRY